METGTVNLFDKIIEGRTLPDGYDSWGIRSVHPDGMSSRGFRWPFSGPVEASGPFVKENGDGCPLGVGDGICLAHTWLGMASGSIPAITILLCAYAQADVLGSTSGEQKLRVRKAYVVDVIDGARLVRENGRGANLRGADLYGADLYGANLYGADLYGANLYGANLYGADLYGANLYGANLYGANLYGADLYGARADAYTAWPVGFTTTGRGIHVAG